MKLSVALCTYNGAEFLRPQLDSILSQELPVSEIVICDDSSTDDTCSLLSDYAQQFPAVIRVHRNEQNLGGKRNFEKALSLCTGDIIFFSDQDDIWLPEKTRMMVGAFEAEPGISGLFSDAVLIDWQGHDTGDRFWNSIQFTEADQQRVGPKELCEYILLNSNIVAGSMLAIRREAMNLVLPFKMLDRMWHDEWIALVLAAANQLGYIRKPLIKYRLHGTQQLGIGKGNAGTDAYYEGVKRMKDPATAENDPLFAFNFMWAVYEKAKVYAAHLPALSGILLNLRQRAFRAKNNLLLADPFFKRKARQLSWLASGRFETSLRDIFKPLNHD